MLRAQSHLYKDQCFSTLEKYKGLQGHTGIHYFLCPVYTRKHVWSFPHSTGAFSLSMHFFAPQWNCSAYKWMKCQKGKQFTPHHMYRKIEGTDKEVQPALLYWVWGPSVHQGGLGSSGNQIMNMRGGVGGQLQELFPCGTLSAEAEIRLLLPPSCQLLFAAGKFK